MVSHVLMLIKKLVSFAEDRDVSTRQYDMILIVPENDEKLGAARHVGLEGR